MTGSRRVVLEALLLRGDHINHFHCFPSYIQLAFDTDLSGETIRRALAELVNRKLVRVVTQHYKNNAYYVNAKLILHAAALTKEAEKEKERRVPDPFGGTGDLEDQDSTDSLEVEGDTDDATFCRNVDEVLELARYLWPEHPTFADPVGRLSPAPRPDELRGDGRITYGLRPASGDDP